MAEVIRTYPKIEFIFEPDNTEPFLRRVEKTCKQLTEIAAKGTPEDKARATAALLAFGHAVNLVQEIAETRNRMLEATSAGPER